MKLRRHTALNRASYVLVTPVHPRPRSRIDALDGAVALHPKLRLIEPLGYLNFLSLTEFAAGVLTDSGGVQEETNVLGVACFTLRANTERPVTVERGTNMVLGLDPGGSARYRAYSPDAARIRTVRRRAGMAAPPTGSSRCSTR